MLGASSWCTVGLVEWEQFKEYLFRFITWHSLENRHIYFSCMMGRNDF